MTGYRETLNLPRADFPMRADLPRREPEWLAWWEERRIYDKLRAQRRGRPVLLLHDGPPYSNAHIHMGTASNKIWKDALVRSASILGFDSPYVPGWDNHGMPIEIQVIKELRRAGQHPDRLALPSAHPFHQNKRGRSREENELIQRLEFFSHRPQLSRCR